MTTSFLNPTRGLIWRALKHPCSLSHWLHHSMSKPLGEIETCLAVDGVTMTVKASLVTRDVATVSLVNVLSVGLDVRQHFRSTPSGMDMAVLRKRCFFFGTTCAASATPA